MQKYRTVSLDLWGFGQSADADDWTIYDYAARVVSLLDALGIERTHVVAHSFGGRIALVLAAHYPDRVARVAVTGCAGLKPRRKLSYYFRVWKFKFLRRFFPKAIAGRQYGSPDYRSLGEGMRRTFKNVVNRDLGYALKHICCPFLILQGERDEATPLYMAKRIHRKVRGSELVLFAGGTHFAYLEETGRFNQIAARFFAQGSEA